MQPKKYSGREASWLKRTLRQGAAQGVEGQDRGQGPVSLASANVDAGGPPEPSFVFFSVFLEGLVGAVYHCKQGGCAKSEVDGTEQVAASKTPDFWFFNFVYIS